MFVAVAVHACPAPPPLRHLHLHHVTITEAHLPRAMRHTSLKFPVVDVPIRKGHIAVPRTHLPTLPQRSRAAVEKSALVIVTTSAQVLAGAVEEVVGKFALVSVAVGAPAPAEG